MQKTEVTLVFDIGKTNKKAILFDDDLKLVHQEERKFEESKDEDDYPCDDFDQIEKWMFERIESFAGHPQYELKAVNFTTYGATIVYIGKDGKRLTPVYNYLKPMDSDVDVLLYKKWGGKTEFTRRTASPAMKLLNSGIQILDLKKQKPQVFELTKHFLHLPQYLSFLLTGMAVAEATYAGCHTGLWDFDNMDYHPWVKDEGIELPALSANTRPIDVEIGGGMLKVGIGIHDSSASLVPYLMGSREKFILVSTGTWCVIMNPFNNEPLSENELENGCLSYLSYEKDPVKSSLIFLGHTHDVNAERIAEHFGVEADSYKRLEFNEELLKQVMEEHSSERIFFKDGLPGSYIDTSVKLDEFDDYEHCYYHLIVDVALVAAEGMELIMKEDQGIKNIYITGGYARSRMFTMAIASLFRDQEVYTSEIDNATSLGAAMVINKVDEENIDLGLNLIRPLA